MTKRCPNPYHVTKSPEEMFLGEVLEMASACIGMGHKLVMLTPRLLTPDQRGAGKAILKDLDRLLRTSAPIRKRLEALIAREEARSAR